MNFDRKLKLAAKGDLKGVKQLLKETPSLLNTPSEGHNRTLLWEAVNANRKELVAYLIQQGADVNIPGRYRAQTYVLLKPFCIAHKKKYETLKKVIMDRGHQMDIFSLAYLGTKEDLIKAVKKNKKLINQLQKEDKQWEVTPLHFALSGNNMATVNILLERGVEVKKYSPLLYEIACRNNRLDFVKLLTKYGGEPGQVKVPSVFHHNNSELIEYFIKQGLDCDKLFAKDWPPIAYLCRGDKGEHPAKIKALLKHVKNINARTPKGVSAMHTASKAGFLSLVKILLEAGAQINIRDHREKTPLHYAIKYKRKEVEFFLKRRGGAK